MIATVNAALEGAAAYSSDTPGTTMRLANNMAATSRFQKTCAVVPRHHKASSATHDNM